MRNRKFYQKSGVPQAPPASPGSLASPSLLQHPLPLPQTPQPSALFLSTPSSLLAGHLLTTPPGTGTCSGPRRGLGVRTQSSALGTPPAFQKRRQGRNVHFKPGSEDSLHQPQRAWESEKGRQALGEGGRRVYSKGSHTRYCPSSVRLCRQITLPSEPGLAAMGSGLLCRCLHGFSEPLLPSFAHLEFHPLLH